MIREDINKILQSYLFEFKTNDTLFSLATELGDYFSYLMSVHEIQDFMIHTRTSNYSILISYSLFTSPWDYKELIVSPGGDVGPKLINYSIPKHKIG